MKINIITNHSNGAGLEQDALMLKNKLLLRGHTVISIQHTDLKLRGLTVPREFKADINFFLEVVSSNALLVAPVNILIPNSEFWYNSNDQYLTLFKEVWCKTKDCYDIWTKKVYPDKCKLIGWEAKDYYDPTILRERKFLHLGGKGVTKNTPAVLEAWMLDNFCFPLTLVSENPDLGTHCHKAPNITFIPRMTDEELRVALNSHLFHLMPSRYEGYGMALNETMGCGNILITTDAPPMNSISGLNSNLLIPSNYQSPYGAAKVNFVKPQHIIEALYKAAAIGPEEALFWQAQARAGFLKDRELFRERLDLALSDLGA